MQTTQQSAKQIKGHEASEILNDLGKAKDGFSKEPAAALKFNKHHITNGVLKARVWYTLDNRTDGRKVVTIYSKDYGNELGQLFSDEYENRTDTMTDLFDKGTVRLFQDHPLYAAARTRAELNKHH